MYINYLDLFSIYIEPQECRIFSFIEKEYKDEISTTQKNQSLIHLTFKEESRKESDYILRDPVSYDVEGAFIFDKENKKVRINFSTLGSDESEIICDPNFHPPFFAILIDYLVSVYALDKNKILIHSSCFSYQGFRILCPAWRNVGKTNSLLSFMEDGALYLADDWCLVDSLGFASKIPKSVCLFDYNLSSFPQIASRVDLSLLPLIEFIKLIESGKIEVNESVDQEVRANMIRRVTPEELFPDKVLNSPQKIDCVFSLVKNSINPLEEVRSSSLKTETLVRRIYEILRLEQSPFRLAYAVHKARSGKENNLLKNEKEIFFKIARNAFEETGNFELLISNQEMSEDVKFEINKRLGNL